MKLRVEGHWQDMGASHTTPLGEIEIVTDYDCVRLVRVMVDHLKKPSSSWDEIRIHWVDRDS